MDTIITNASILLADIGPNDHMGWGDGGWIVMAVGMTLFWGLLIVGAAWLVRTSHSNDHHRAIPGPDAMAILARRLAEGEISPEEYRERRSALDG